jgi:hypothetical protein
MRRRSGQAHLTCSSEHLVCPACGYSVLRRRGFLSRWAECESFCCALDGITVGTLEQIVALPDALGEHACECGHPYMRSLPEGTFHCPACQSEVVHAGSNLGAVVSYAVDGEQRRGAAHGAGKGSRAWLLEDCS